MEYCCYQDNKEKPAVPFVQLNVIRLFAELSVAVNKAELVDTILPLFIESLEEGDASTPSLLRLRVWNFMELCLQSMCSEIDMKLCLSINPLAVTI